MKRLVIKVGSHVLTENDGVATARMLALVEFIAELVESGKEVILVSSGAVSAGYTALKIDRHVVANRQALAAVGQPLLLKMYQEKFAKFNFLCSQILLAAQVFDSRKQTSYAKGAIDALLENHVVPIINENDTVSVDELVFGDNDRLSAHVAHYFKADMLVILSDIDAYYDKDPNKFSDAKVRETIHELTTEELTAEQTPNTMFATGGIVTKLQAADFLMQRGKEMFLASGFDLASAKSFLLEGKQSGGTLFLAK
jgi:glutamate 5-kinase